MEPMKKAISSDKVNEMSFKNKILLNNKISTIIIITFGLLLKSDFSFLYKQRKYLQRQVFMFNPLHNVTDLKIRLL